MKHITYFAVFFLLNPFLYSQEISYPERTEMLSSFELIVEEIPTLKGEIRIAIFDSEEAYNRKEDPIHAIVLPASETTVTWKDQQLPYGNYAIAVYHDKNENGELDTNILGVPKEAYGFSNNANGKFGPASWKDASFEVASPSSNMRIIIK